MSVCVLIKRRAVKTALRAKLAVVRRRGERIDAFATLSFPTFSQHPVLLESPAYSASHTHLKTSYRLQCPEQRKSIPCCKLFWTTCLSEAAKEEEKAGNHGDKAAAQHTAEDVEDAWLTSEAFEAFQQILEDLATKKRPSKKRTPARPHFSGSELDALMVDELSFGHFDIGVGAGMFVVSAVSTLSGC